MATVLRPSGLGKRLAHQVSRRPKWQFVGHAVASYQAVLLALLCSMVLNAALRMHVPACIQACCDLNTISIATSSAACAGEVYKYWLLAETELHM